MMFDRAITLFGLGLTIILGLYTLAPPGWPKVPPLALLSGMGVGVLLFGIGAGLMIADYRRLHRPDFEIEFDPTDRRFVAIEQDRIVYFVGLRNRSHQSIFHVSIRTNNSEFTNEILTEDQTWGHSATVMNLFIASVLDPDALEFVRLFDLPTEDKLIRRDHTDLLSRRHRFPLEVRGRHARTYSTEFEYDPSRFPRLRQC